MIEQIKKQVQEINFAGINLNHKHRDGRVNSSIYEENIFNLLKKNSFFKNKIYRSHKERNWFDFSINFKNGSEELFYPVNIKIIVGNKNDNLNCKLGIYYSLTGKIPSFSNEIGWEKFFRELHNQIKQTKKDYYFLVIYKKNWKGKFIGLRQINKLTPNGNNLPFQCNFSDKKNLTLNNENFDNDKKRILNCFYESIKKRTTIRDYFEKFFVKNGKVV